MSFLRKNAVEVYLTCLDLYKLVIWNLDVIDILLCMSYLSCLLVSIDFILVLLNIDGMWRHLLHGSGLMFLDLQNWMVWDSCKVAIRRLINNSTMPRSLYSLLFNLQNMRHHDDSLLAHLPYVLSKPSCFSHENHANYPQHLLLKLGFV